MKLTDTQKKLLKGIQGKLVRGDIKSIAEKFDKSQEWISMILSPESDYFRMDIVEAAAEIITTRERNTKKLLEKVNQVA